MLIISLSLGGKRGKQTFCWHCFMLLCFAKWTKLWSMYELPQIMCCRICDLCMSNWEAVASLSWLLCLMICFCVHVFVCVCVVVVVCPANRQKLFYFFCGVPPVSNSRKEVKLKRNVTSRIKEDHFNISRHPFLLLIASVKVSLVHFVLIISSLFVCPSTWKTARLTSWWMLPFVWWNIPISNLF